VIAASSTFAFKIAAKPLQIDMITNDSLWELVIVLSDCIVADPYQVRFRHNTFVTVDDKQTNDTSYARLDLTADQK